MGNCIYQTPQEPEILPVPTNQNNQLSNKLKTTMYESFYLSFNVENCAEQTTNGQTLKDSYKSPSLDSVIEDLSEVQVMLEISISEESKELPTKEQHTISQSQ
ncbi:Hypothetical_protein [Hexamita inflata]|uniref:Hypothetical_protein n=1 Tax=Hexamita inflata TaxID=28002 RepID=A0AA86NQ97_9EUKA|nr:Hypothetical protein HINF_LOCUS11001 [Hexamita inflata]